MSETRFEVGQHVAAGGVIGVVENVTAKKVTVRTGSGKTFDLDPVTGELLEAKAHEKPKE